MNIEEIIDKEISLLELDKAQFMRKRVLNNNSLEKLHYDQAVDLARILLQIADKYSPVIAEDLMNWNQNVLSQRINPKLLSDYFYIIKSIVQKADDPIERLRAVSTFAFNFFNTGLIDEVVAESFSENKDHIAELFCGSRNLYLPYVSMIAKSKSVINDTTHISVRMSFPRGAISQFHVPRRRWLIGYIELARYIKEDTQLIFEDADKISQQIVEIYTLRNQASIFNSSNQDKEICGVHRWTGRNFIIGLYEWVKNKLSVQKISSDIAVGFAEYMFLHFKKSISVIYDYKQEHKERIESLIQVLENKFRFAGMEKINGFVLPEYFVSQPFGDLKKNGRTSLIEQFFFQIEQDKELKFISEMIQKRIDECVKTGKYKGLNDIKDKVESWLTRVNKECSGEGRTLSFGGSFPFKDLGRTIQHILLLNKPLDFDSVVVRTSTGYLLEEIISSRSGRCTSGDGRFRHIAYDYYRDESIGLIEIFGYNTNLERQVGGIKKLHPKGWSFRLVQFFNKNRDEVFQGSMGSISSPKSFRPPVETKIGDIVLLEAYEKASLEKIWVVETVEVNYNDIMRLNAFLRASNWKELLYYSILKAAKSAGIKNVLFNVSVDHKPTINEFLFFIAEANGIESENKAKRLRDARVRNSEVGSMPYLLSRQFMFKNDEDYSTNCFELFRTQGNITYMSAWKNTSRDYKGFISTDNPNINNGIGYVTGIKVNIIEALKSKYFKNYILY